MNRKATILRTTKETDITVDIALDGAGLIRSNCGIPFLDHMFTSFAMHGGFGLTVECKGDTEVDDHHSAEDLGICLGQAIDGALENKLGINRFGHATIPMDESLVRVVLDLSGRSFIHFDASLLEGKWTGNFDTGLVKEFFQAVAQNGNMTIHIDVLHGGSPHHIVEAMFKAFGKALKEAVTIDEKKAVLPSTKGLL